MSAVKTIPVVKMPKSTFCVMLQLRFQRNRGFREDYMYKTFTKKCGDHRYHVQNVVEICNACYLWSLPTLPEIVNFSNVLSNYITPYLFLVKRNGKLSNCNFFISSKKMISQLITTHKTRKLYKDFTAILLNWSAAINGRWTVNKIQVSLLCFFAPRHGACVCGSIFLYIGLCYFASSYFQVFFIQIIFVLYMLIAEL